MSYLKSHHDLEQQDNMLVSMDACQATIHKQKQWHVHIDSPTLADEGAFEMYFKTPDSTVRICAEVIFTGELAGIGCIRESATVSLSGSVITVYNRDRNYTGTSTTSVRSSPTFSASGTCLTHIHVGGGKKGFDGGVGAAKFWKLKQGTIYLFRYTSAAASNEASISVDFHED